MKRNAEIEKIRNLHAEDDILVYPEITALRWKNTGDGCYQLTIYGKYVEWYVVKMLGCWQVYTTYPKPVAWIDEKDRALRSATHMLAMVLNKEEKEISLQNLIDARIEEIKKGTVEEPRIHVTGIIKKYALKEVVPLTVYEGYRKEKGRWVVCEEKVVWHTLWDEYVTEANGKIKSLPAKAYKLRESAQKFPRFTRLWVRGLYE